MQVLVHQVTDVATLQIAHLIQEAKVDRLILEPSSDESAHRLDGP